MFKSIAPMPAKTDKINARLLFIISFSVTALAIYLFKFVPSGATVHVPHNFWLNVLFINITFLGSAIFCFGLILYLFYKKQYAIARLITGSTLLSLLLIQIIKNYLSIDGIQIFFEDEQYLFNATETSIQLVSSHTALAFSLATFFVLHFNNRILRYSILLLAIVVAWSRIYLSHHTLPDLFAGAFIGLFSGCAVYYYYLNYVKFKKPSLFTSRKFNNGSIPANTFSIE